MGGRFRFLDETTRPPVELAASQIEASLRGLVKDPKRPDATATLEASLAVERLVAV